MSILTFFGRAPHLTPSLFSRLCWAFYPCGTDDATRLRIEVIKENEVFYSAIVVHVASSLFDGLIAVLPSALPYSLLHIHGHNIITH